MVTVIYSWSLSNHLRRWKDEGFDWFDLNRVEGVPEGGPGSPIDVRGHFFGASLFGIAGRTNFCGMRILGFGFGLMRFEFAISFVSRFRFTSFFLRIKISSYSESSSSESSSLKASRSGGISFFHRESGKTFVISNFASIIEVSCFIHQNKFYIKGVYGKWIQKNSMYIWKSLHVKVSKNTIQVPIFEPKNTKQSKVN